MTKSSKSIKAPQQSLKSSWKGIESFKQKNIKGMGTVVTYNKNGRDRLTRKYRGEYIKGSTTSGYQY